jgi:hypothetical protein
MYTITNHQLIESYTKTNKCWAVYIAGGQFDYENDDSPTSWKGFIDTMNKVFSIQYKAFRIYNAVMCSELIVFETEEDVNKIFDIMNSSPYYSEIYALVSGPDGLISENT